ncbi:MAG: hypothetical protein K2L93_08800 [Muribaculaceae bacterium]|nr:hypothetical protein [Muribaculaceae bacterium]
MKTLTRLLIFILAIPSLLFLTSCPHELEKNPDVPGYIDADFIGVWKCIDDSEIYYLLLDPYGAGKWVNEDLDDDEITSTSIDWYYNDGSLTVRFPKFTEKYVVVKLTESLMILGDKWGELTFRRIKASDIPEYKPGGDDPNDPDSPNDNPNDDKTDGQIKTVSAEPSAFSAVVSGIYSGKTAPDYVGVQYSYYKDFPESQSATRSIEGRLGEYQVKATGIVDQVKVYYRAYAVIGDQYIYGETKSFQTPQGTYTLNGTTYKFIKVTGLATGSFSMMQTELPADADITIDGTEINCIDYYKKNGYVEAGEIQGFLCESCEGVTPLLRYPSREEWLFAFSGGSLSNGYKYSGSNDIGEVEWYSANYNAHA